MKIKKVSRTIKVKKVVCQKDPSFNLAQIIYKAADKMKAENIVGLDLNKLASFTDYLVICSGNNSRLVRAIAEEVEKEVRQKIKKYPLGIEGLNNSQWVLMDYGDVVVHIFLTEVREFYQLEKLWHDAKKVFFTSRKSV